MELVQQAPQIVEVATHLHRQAAALASGQSGVGGAPYSGSRHESIKDLLNENHSTAEHYKVA